MGTNPTDFSTLPPGVDTVIITAFARPDEGGIQRSVDQIASGLGRRVLVIAPPHPNSGRHDQSAPYSIWRRYIFSGRLRPSWLWFVRWAWRQRRYGLKTIFFGHYSAAAAAGPFLKLAGLQYIILVHGRDLLLEERRWRWLVGLVLRRAAWVGVNSRFVAELVHRHGVPSAHIVRTHPAVPDAMIQVSPSMPGHAVVTVSRLVSRKNIAAVIRALPEILHLHPDARYDVVGDGPERERLEALASELGVERSVVFHGLLPDAERDRLLGQAGCFVMVPAVAEAGADVEGLGLVFLEAAARGLPIVASPTGGVADIVQDGRTGRMVAPDDVHGLAQAIVDSFANGRDFARQARALVETEFTWSVRNARVAAMLDHPLAEIGVVIPVWNSADRIGRTLADVFAQTVPPSEVVIVDDGSTDDLETALRPYANRIKLIRQSNQGAAAARNVGAMLIHSPYIIFVDADISLHPKTFEKMARVLITHPEAAYAYSSFDFGPKTFSLFDFDAQRLRRVNYIHTTSLIRRSAAVPFDPALTKFQDWDLWLTMLAQGKIGCWVPERLFSVRQEGGTMSAWIPSFVYRLPGIGRGRGSKTIARYRQAESIIRQKHALPPG